MKYLKIYKAANQRHLYTYSACYSRHFGKKITIKKPPPNTRLTLYKICWFSLQCTDSFSESGSRKHFQGSGMRAIDSPHKITPRGLLVKKIWKNFFGDRAANGTPFKLLLWHRIYQFFSFFWIFFLKSLPTILTKVVSTHILDIFSKKSRKKSEKKFSRGGLYL